MADEPVQATLPDITPPEASIPATPETDPTPSQVDSKQVKSGLDAEIDSLWAEAEGRAPKALMGEDATPEPPATGTAPPPKAETPKADEKPPEPDRATIEREAEERARARIADEQRATQEADTRLRAEQTHRQQYEAYVGPDADYQAVNLALRQAFTGDATALNDLDVVLPNGQKVSQIKGEKGLTEAEAANLLTAWDTARKYEDVMGTRKVQQLVDLWNADIMRTLSDPDVDTAAVTRHAQPHQQMEALRDSVRERVTKRLTDQHTEVVKAKDAEIKRLSDRVESLVTERSTLTSHQTASAAATPDRPGQPGAARPSVPTPEELAEMPFDQAFKSGAIDRVLQSLPGGLQAPRRRAG